MENIGYKAIDLDLNEEVLVHCPCEYESGQIVIAELAGKKKQVKILERI